MAVIPPNPEEASPADHAERGVEPERDVEPIPARGLPSPLPYHRRMQSLLQRRYPKIWTWFASGAYQEKHRRELQLELLKTTYRLTPEAHPELHERLRQAAGRLGLEAPWTLYQGQTGLDDESRCNASLAYVPGEIHLIFRGPILKVLDSGELDALIGHELTHYLFYQQEEHRFFVAARILNALARDELADPAYLESLRLYDLFTEILADRGAYAVTGRVEPAVRLLVKVCTGAESVDAASYLEQAEEIFGQEVVETAGISHPELFIRARALELWRRYVDDSASTEQAVDGPVDGMIQGKLRFSSLDLIRQHELARHTRGLIHRLLHPTWMRTDAALAHARLFFNDFEPVEDEIESSGLRPEDLRDEELRRYFVYVLTDFVALTRELEDGAVAAAFARAEELGLGDLLAETLHQELRITKTVLKRIRRDTSSILTSAAGDPAAGTAGGAP